MTRQDVLSMLGGKPRRISDTTVVWEGEKGTSPMTPLEQKMWKALCSLTNGS
jgi:hypothetical protein